MICWYYLHIERIYLISFEMIVLDFIFMLDYI